MKNLIYIFILLGLVSCKKDIKITKTKDWIYTEEKLADGSTIYKEERVENNNLKKKKISPFSFDDVDKIEMLSYPSRTMWDTIKANN